MTDKINNILLGTLWLLVATLGSCFWFNSQYGFNIFSGTHWRHLGYMQAAQTPVQPSFYISMVIAVFVIIYVLYLLLRPHIRKIPIPHRHITHSNYRQTELPKSVSAPVQTGTQSAPTPSPVIPIPSAPPQGQTPVSEQIPEIDLSRPPRLNIALTPILHTPHVPVVPQPTPQSSDKSHWPELHKIFESAGYVIKPSPRIAGIQTALFAIGTGETVWIGAVNTKTSVVQSAIDTLNQIFLDTLDEIIINVNGFVLSAIDSASPESPNILTFDTPSSLDKYISEHPNPPLSATDDGEFEAFSSYISTVIEYLGKM